MSYVTAQAKGKPAGMSAAVIVNGSIVAAIMLSPMVVNTLPDTGRTKVINVEPKTPPPIEKPDLPKVIEDAVLPPVYVPPTPYDRTVPDDPITTTTEFIESDPPIFDGKGEEQGQVIEKIEKLIKPPPPIFKAALRDPRWMKNFQPDYPPRLLQREIEGSARVRVLIGTNGRVRQASVVSATHRDFGKATVKHARAKWRFKPATRDGVAVEDWKTLTVQFTIT